MPTTCYSAGVGVSQIARIYKDDGSVRIEYAPAGGGPCCVFELTADQWVAVSAPHRVVVDEGAIVSHVASDDGMPECSSPEVYVDPVVYLDLRAVGP